MATNPDEQARRTEEALSEVESGARSISSATETAASRMQTISQDLSGTGREIDSRVGEAAQGFSQLGSSVISFGKALSSNDSSLSKYAGAIEGAGDGLALLATAAFGPLGLVLGLVAKAFTSLIGAELKQTDKILGNFEKLGELGAAAQMTSGQIEGMFNEAGFSTFNGQSQMIVKTVTSLGTDLTKLGATSAAGIKTFTQLASFNSNSLEDQQKIRNQFANLGYSQEKLLNAQASFMKEQGALGFGKKQVDDKLVKQSLDYTKNLSMLSALTGESADAIKASRQKDLEDFAFNVSLRQLGDTEAGKKQRELVQNMSTMIGAKVDPIAQKAFRDVFANGAAITAESQALSMRTHGAFVTWTNDFKSGKLSPEGFINKLNESGDAALQSMAAALKGNAALREAMGIGTDTVKNTAVTMAEGTMGSIMNEVNNKMGHIDQYVNFANITKNLADQFAKMMDELLKLLAPMLIDAFTWLIEATMSLIKGLMESRLAKAFGIDFSPLLLKMTSTGEVANQVDDLVLKLEQEKKNKDTFFGGTPSNVWEQLKDFNIDFRTNDERITDIEDQLKNRATAINDRGLLYPGNPFNIPSKDENKPSAPAKSSTSSTQSGTMDAYKPRGGGQQPLQQNPAPQYKFGGITGNGFGDISEKISGGGIFDGPTSGYRKTLPKNKNFAVVPLPSGDTIPVSFKGDMGMDTQMPADLTGNKANPLADMSSISDMMSEMANIFKNSIEESPSMVVTNDTSNRKSSTALASITNKLDTLLERIRLNNNLQTELLDYAKG